VTFIVKDLEVITALFKMANFNLEILSISVLDVREHVLTISKLFMAKLMIWQMVLEPLTGSLVILQIT